MRKQVASVRVALKRSKGVASPLEIGWIARVHLSLVELVSLIAKILVVFTVRDLRFALHLAILVPGDRTGAFIDVPLDLFRDTFASILVHSNSR